MKGKYQYLLPFTKKSHGIYLTAFVVAACSVIYELLLAQTISFFCAHTVFWYSLTIGFYLGAMGLGTLFCNKIYRGTQNWDALLKTEVLLSVFGALSVLAVNFAYMFVVYVFFHYELFNTLMVFFLCFFVLVIGIGFLTGLELPLLIRIGKDSIEDKTITNRILAVDYFGTLIGAILFPLLLMPRFELLTISFFVATVNLIVALGILFTQAKEHKGRRIVFNLILGLGFFLVLAIVRKGDIQQYLLQKYYYGKDIALSSGLMDFLSARNDSPKVERFKSPYQKIDMVQFDTEGDPYTILMNTYRLTSPKRFNKSGGYAMFLDGFFQFLSDYEEIYHEYFAHVPVILNGKIPQHVLVLGAGDGLLLRELLKYSKIKSIILVELDERIIKLARTHPTLRQINKASLEDPRVNIVIADAYHYLKRSSLKFDAIYIDFPDPKDYNLSKLYSREFYHFVKIHLKRDGYAVFDAPGVAIPYSGETEDDKAINTYDFWEIYFNTLKASGFKTVIPYISFLEEDNNKAKKIVEDSVGNITHMVVLKKTEKGKEKVILKGRKAVVKEIITEFIDSHQHGFIMLKENAYLSQREYKNPGITFSFINERRFYSSFGLPYKFYDTLDYSKVNSIMRPTLPIMTAFDEVRVPF